VATAGLPGVATVVDLIREFGYPVLLVARAGLGTVNHTLMSLEILRARKLNVLGVVINGFQNEAAEQDNPRMIEEYGQVKVLARVPREGSKEQVEQEIERVVKLLFREE